MLNCWLAGATMRRCPLGSNFAGGSGAYAHQVINDESVAFLGTQPTRR